MKHGICLLELAELTRNPYSQKPTRATLMLSHPQLMCLKAQSITQ